MAFFEREEVAIEELNIQVDHVQMILQIPPKLSVLEYLGMVKGHTAIRIVKQFAHLK